MLDPKKTVLTVIAAGIVALAADANWRNFMSTEHFSVSYPAAWLRIAKSSDQLQILSSKGGAEGVVIMKGQVEIVVRAPEASSGATLAEVTKTYSQGTTVLSQKEMPTEYEAGACSRLTEIVSKEPVVPQEDSPVPVPFVINTDFFCEAQGHKVVVLLRNYEGDIRQQQYQQIAVHVAKSLRVW